MNTDVIAPEVQDFLDVVRSQLVDVDADEQREILDGLEADLTDLVAERGGEALGDPVAYARELRAAAGLEPEIARPFRARRTAGLAISDLLDTAHQGFDAVSSKMPGDVPGILSWLRPIWWVLRAWVAVQLIDMSGGRPRAYLVPDLGGLGWLACVAAIAFSVAAGRGAVWPGGAHRGWFPRLVLIAVNVFAVGAAPIAVSQVIDDVNHRYDRGAARGFDAGFRSAVQQAPVTRQDGLYADGRPVSQIFPYDAKGRPLVGVQLYDQDGQPIVVSGQATCPENADAMVDDPDTNQVVRCEDPETLQPLPITVPYPWTNGRQEVLNVFPFATRVQDQAGRSVSAFTEPTPPRIAFPLASVPKVSLPGIRPGAFTSSR
jgi:hypothetical protein